MKKKVVGLKTEQIVSLILVMNKKRRRKGSEDESEWGRKIGGSSKNWNILQIEINYCEFWLRSVCRFNTDRDSLTDNFYNWKQNTCLYV